MTESFPDQLSIDTPEHVSLRLPVAGLGSRFLALFADTVIQVAAYVFFIVLLVLLLSGAHTGGSAHVQSDRAKSWTIAILIFLHFLLYWGYFTLFEGLWQGQTPGKRMFHLRVIKDSGRQITLFESAARNLLRIVDVIPSMYLLGSIVMMANRQKKRVGDFVAGTLVVHQEQTEESGSSDSTRTFTIGFFESQATDTPAEIPGAVFPAPAIARLTVDDLVLLDTFFLRIPDLDVQTKEQMTQRLLSTLCAKMGMPVPPDVSPRSLLESIAYKLRNHTSLNLH